MARAARSSGNEQWRGVTVVLTDDRGICRIHAQCLGQPRVTDVISLRYEPVPGEPGGPTGDIVVNAERAVQESHRWKGRGGASRELALYIAHGCDHLAGETDDDERGQARMRRRELRWLRQAEEAGLIAPCCRE